MPKDLHAFILLLGITAVCGAYGFVGLWRIYCSDEESDKIFPAVKDSIKKMLSRESPRPTPEIRPFPVMASDEEIARRAIMKTLMRDSC